MRSTNYKKAKNVLEKTHYSYIKSGIINNWLLRVLAELSKTDCPVNLYILIKSFLNEREINYVRNGEKISKTYNRGCPYVSISGPLLWNIVNNSVCQTQLENNIYVQAYAHDFIVLVADTTKYGAEHKAMETVQKLENWSQKIKRSFCHEKTQMLFRPSSSVARPRMFVKFQGRCIRRAKDVKYLGLIIDCRMNWAKLMVQLKTKVITISNWLRSMC